MNFGKGGQNIVQSGNNNPNVFRGAGNILGQYLGTKMRRNERDYNREQDYKARKDFEDYKNTSKVKSNLLEGMMSPHVVGNYFDVANSTHDENSDEVKNKVINPDTNVPYAAGDPKRPQFAHFVNNFGIQTSKHGILPGQPGKGEAQERERNKRKSADQITKQSSTDEYSGTVARFGKDGKMSREAVSLEDIEYGEKTSERPPASMREVDDSTRPSNQTFTDQQKADLEKERPRTSNLNTGMNEGKDPSHAKNVADAWTSGKITSSEASELSKPGLGKDTYDNDADLETNQDVYDIHKSAGLNNNNKGTKY